jgi:hypothetical protein
VLNYSAPVVVNFGVPVVRAAHYFGGSGTWIGENLDSRGPGTAAVGRGAHRAICRERCGAEVGARLAAEGVPP